MEIPTLSRLSDVPIGEWFGVNTDANDWVRELGLGEKPVESVRYRRSWATSPTWRWLRLSENQLSGEIPPELGNLASLSTLDLGETTS